MTTNPTTPKLIQTKYGYWTFDPLPSDEELNQIKNYIEQYKSYDYAKTILDRVKGRLVKAVRVVNEQLDK